MFGFGRKKKPSASDEQKDRQIPAPSAGIKGSLISLEQRLMFDAAASATASEVASEQVAQEQAEAAVSSEHHADGPSAEQAESEGLLDAIATYNPGESRSEVVFVDPTVPNYQDLISGMAPNVEVIMLDGGQDGVEQMANALSGRTGIDAIHVISHGEAGALQLGTGILNADSMSTDYADDLAVIQQSLSEQADILVYGCEFAQGEAGQAAVDLLAQLTGADVQASTDLTGSISLGGDWEFEVSTGTIETSLAIDYDAQMNWAAVLGNETVADTFSDKSYGNNDGTSSWSSNWSEVDRGGSDADGGHIKVNSGELRIETQVVGASVSRGVDLSGARSATLSFDYENDLDRSGAVEVRISTDGGANYRTLTDGAFSRTNHTGSGTARFDISDYMSADTKIQFVVTGTSGGDRLFIDNVQVDYNVADANTAPTDLSLSANSVAENASTGTVVGTVSGTDPDTGDTKTYSLTDTAGGRFAINASTGVITVADGSLLNYESAASHNLTVQVTDSGGQSYTESFTINLTNVNEGPTDLALSANSVAENASTGTVVGTVSGTDPDAGDTKTYSLTDTAGGRFAINASTGVITVADGSLLNYESAASHNLTVRVADSGGQSYTESFTINLTNVNEGPTDLALSANTVAENASTGTVVGTVSGTDPDASDTKTYSLTDTAGGRFAINASTGVITVADGSLLNYEAAASHSLTVRVTDSGGQSYTEQFTINLTNVNEGPTDLALSANTVAENASTGTVVGTVSGTDPDAGDTKTYSLTDTAGGRFAINASTGVITVADGSLLNYESAASHNLTVQVTDSAGQSYTESFTINLTNVNEGPTDLALSANTVAENASTGTVVGTVSGTDPDASDTKTYSLTDTAGGRFAINASTGVITVADGSLLNYEAAASHNLTVQVTDSGGQSYTESFTINLTNVNEGPTDLALSANTVAENASTGTVVGTVSGTDPDAGDTKTYSLTDTAGGRFAINASTGVITVADGSLLNYESAVSHSLTVQVTDSGGQSYTESFTINLTNVNEGPTDLALSANTVAENASTGTVVGTVSGTDPDAGDTKTYSLTDTAGGRFAINASTGVITVADGSLLNYENAASHNLTVQVTDSGGQSYTEQFTINLTNVNEGPTITSQGGGETGTLTVEENSTSVTTVTATDADAGQTLSYSIVGGADAAQFTINSSTGQLSFVSALNFEAPTDSGGNNVYDVTVQVSDGQGGTDTQDIAVSVANVNEAPTDLVQSTGTGIDLNTDGGNNSYLYTTSGGAILGGRTAFSIEAQFSATSTPVSGEHRVLLSYATTRADNEVRVGIAQTSSTTCQLTLTVNNSRINLSGYDASRLFDGGQHQLGVTWSSTNGGYTFYVDGQQVGSGTGLQTGFTTRSSGTLVVGVDQDSVGGGFQTSQVFKGTLQDVRIFNDVRTAAEISSYLNRDVPSSESGLVADWTMNNLSGGSTADVVAGRNLTVGSVSGTGWVTSTPSLIWRVPENASNGTVVGTVTGTDPDASDTKTYSLTDTAGGRFAINASTGEITVADGSLLNYEDATSHSVTVRVTDAGGQTYDERFSINLANVNEAPTDLSLSASSVAENATTGTVVGTVSGADSDSRDTKTYSLTDTAGGRFAINSSTGVITVANGALLNYESAQSHDITVQVTDRGGLTYRETFAINLTNVNETPTISSQGGGSTGSVTVAENGTSVTTVMATDSDVGQTLTYSIVGGADAAQFTINSSTGQLSFLGAPNYEVPTDSGGNNIYDVTVQVSDGQGGTDTQAIAVSVTNVNETPTDLSLSANSVAENATTGTVVGTVTGTDPDANDTKTYSLTDTAGGRFAINASTGVITVADGSLLNYESAASHNLTVRVTDSGGQSYTEQFTINLTNVNEGLTDLSLSANSVAENAATGTVVGTVTGTDPDASDTKTYSLTDTAGGRFAINASTGVITVADGSLLNYEAAASHNLTVQVTDSAGQSFTESFTINLTNVNEGPTDLALSANSVAENATTGTVVGTVTGTDPDASDTKTYSLTDTAGGRFAINASTGVITVADGSLLNYENAASHNLTVQVTDSAGQRYTESFTINLTNVNEGPTDLSLSANSVAENATTGTVVGTVTGTDPDAGDTKTYSLTDTAGGRFAINASTGVITVADGSLLNYEAAASHNLTVQVTDSGGQSYTESFTINLTNVNEGPTDLALSANTVAENASTGTVVGTVSGTDPDAGDTKTYSLTDTAGGRFAINASTGVITVADGSLLNYESAASHNLTVQVTDSGGQSYTESFTINLTNVNEGPTDLALSANSVDENAATGTVVGTVSGTDPDAGDTKTYSLTDTAGGRFAINASTGVITVADGSLLNYESAASHTIIVQVTDAGGLTHDQTFTINLTNLYEAPLEVDGGDGGEQTLVASLFQKSPAGSEPVQPFILSQPTGGDSESKSESADDLRKPVEWEAQAVPPVDILNSGRNVLDLIHGGGEKQVGEAGKKEHISTSSRQQDDMAADLDAANAARLEPGRVSWPSVAETESIRADSEELAKTMVAGLVGAAIQGNIRKKEKIATMDGELRAGDPEAANEQTSPEQPSDETKAPPEAA